MLLWKKMHTIPQPFPKLTSVPGITFLAFLATLFPRAEGKGGNSSLVCGKKFRIATHLLPPYINILEEQCPNQRCSFTIDPANYEGGGMTFDFVNKYLAPQLKDQCQKEGKAPVVFEWYIPSASKQLEQSPLNMMCNSNFGDVSEFLPASFDVSQDCPSMSQYKGPSNPSACTAIGDPTCVSPGPDMAAGLIDITVLRLDQFVFTTPYHFTSQVVLRQPIVATPIGAALLNIFECFSLTTWGIIGLEVIIATILLLVFEMRTNEAITDGWASLPDSAYWSVSTLFGGADKRAETLAGRFIFAGHAFFSVIIIATYTGSLGAFLTADQSLPRLDTFSDVEGGGYSTAVVGPKWNSSSASPSFLGTYMGGDGNNGSSAQFEIIQAILATNSSASFQIFTTQNLFTLNSKGTLFEKVGALDSGNGINPCDTPSASHGVFDMVACGYPAGKSAGSWADSGIVDLSVGVYELNQREKRLLNCEILLIPETFQSLGIGLAFPPSQFGPQIADYFSLAITNLADQGVMQNLLIKYAARLDDASCVYAAPSTSLTLEEASGVFIICAFLCIGSVIHGSYERYLYLREIQDSDQTQGFEKEEECRRIVNDDTPEVDPNNVEKQATPQEEMAGTLEEMDAQIARIEVLAKLIQERRVQMSAASGIALAAPPSLEDEAAQNEAVKAAAAEAEKEGNQDLWAPFRKSLKSLVFWGSGDHKEQ